MASPPAEGGSQKVGRSTAVAAAVAGLFAVAALTGWAMIWLRFTGAGIPAQDALDATSLWRLLLIGGARLALFALLAVPAVLLALFIDRRGTLLGHSVAATLLATFGIVIAIAEFDASGSERALAIALTVGAGLVASLVAVATTDNFVHRWLERHRWVVPAGSVALTVVCSLSLYIMEEEILALASAAIGGLVSIVLALAVLPPARRARIERFPRAGSMVVFIGAAARDLWFRVKPSLQAAGVAIRSSAAIAGVALLAGLLWLVLKTWTVPALVVFAAGLVAALLAVRRWRNTLRWYAVSVFAAVLLFGSALSALNTWWDPDLRPVAVLLPDGSEHVGIYVTRNAGAIYIGNVHICPRNSSNLTLKLRRAVSGTGEVTRISDDQAKVSLGGGTKLKKVYARADVLLNDLRQQAGLAPHPARDRCAVEGVLDLKPRPTKAVPARRAAKMAARFRPILLFDSRERWRPLNVDMLLAERRAGNAIHRLCTPIGSCHPIRSPRDVNGSNDDYIDFDGEFLGGDDFHAPDLAACREPDSPRLLDCNDGPPTAVYYHVTAANDRVYVDYWWFLRYNHFDRYNAKKLCRSGLLRNVSGVCSEHEGDWEGVTAVTAPGDPNRLEFVSYAQHTGVVRRPLERLRHDGQRPYVYVADGSHAAYARECPHSCKQTSKLFFGRLPEDNTDGRKPWGRNDTDACGPPHSCLLPLPRTAWGPFKGLWGSRSCKAGRRCRLAQAPRTPSAQQRYRYPWCYSLEERELACDGQEPTTNSQVQKWKLQGRGNEL
jgi:hypothetical protein